MNCRDQFEESYSKTYGTPKRVLESLRYNDTYHVTDGDRVDIAWHIWKASREQLVIELTPDINPVMFNDDVVFGYQKAKNEVIEVLKTAGITVKSD